MMLRRRKVLRTLIVGSAVLVAAVDAAAVEPTEFAVGWPLELPSERGFFDVPLTLEIYQGARRLEEIAVLDARGEPMPFYRVSPASPAATERRVELRASPVYATAEGERLAELNVTTDGGRRSLIVTDRGDATGEIVAFVLDARRLDAAPRALDLKWRPRAQPFLMEVTIEQSRTLTDWRPVGRASIAALSIDGAEIRHGRVPVAAEAGGYYRIKSRRTVPDWHLESATLVSVEAAPTPAPFVARFAPTADRPTQESPERSAVNERALYFDIGGELPVTTVTIDFTTINRWVKASLASSDSLDGPWRIRSGTRLFYELDYEGEELTSPVVNLGRVEDRYWRVMPEHAPPAGAVELSFTYSQEYLRFAANGSAPYTLVAGTVSDVAGPDATLAAVWAELHRDAELETATIGERIELGGPAALLRERAFPWRQTLLWLVLSVGVLAVAAMAIRLARETRKTS